MSESFPVRPAETADQMAARYFALGTTSTRGMREWLGAPGSTDPASPEILALAAADTVKYLGSRPAGPEDLPDPDAHYEATLPPPLAGKTARQLVEEWAEADRQRDRTLANDITEALTERALNWAATTRGRHSVERLEFAAHNFNALYDRKQRLAKQQPIDLSVSPPREQVAAQQQFPPAIGRARPQPPGAPPAVMEPTPIRKPAMSTKPGLRRWNNLALAAWVRLTNFYSHPEKGRRRVLLTAAAAGAAALAGAGVAWLADLFTDQNNLPQHTAKPPAPKPKFTEAFFDNLQPTKYSGQKYEWNAIADQLSAAQATPELLQMIEDARAQGAKVDKWGSPAAGHWGIDKVSVRLSDGTWKSYFDTPHKLAVIQYLARLQRLQEEGDDDI